MSLPKKGSRLIEVNGVKYRWRTSGNDYGINCFVEHSETPGQLLRRIFPYVKRANGEQVAITSADVAALIDYGLSEGWTPQKNGPMFEC